MKNLKTIITAFLLLFIYTNSFSQTKEETIEWLTQKLNDYVRFPSGDRLNFFTNFKIKKIDGCSIVLTYDQNNPGGIWKVHNYEVILPTKNAGFSEDGAFLYPSRVIIVMDHTIGEKNFWEDSAPIRIREIEPDLRNRMLKAIKHLNTFCKPEAF